MENTNIIDLAEVNKVEVVEEETKKESVFKRAKGAIKEKAANFEEKHPKAAKVGKTIGKVAVGGALVVGGIFVGNAISKQGEWTDMDDYPGYDDDVADDATSEEVTE